MSGLTEIQRIVAKRIIPLNIEYIKNHVPELHDKIPELERTLKSIESKEVRRKET